MKRFIIVLILTATMLLILVQISLGDDIIMFNIELVSKRVSKLNSQINDLKLNLKNIDKKVRENSQHVEALESSMSKKIKELEEELQDIEIDYEKTLKQIELFRSENKEQDSIIGVTIKNLSFLESNVRQLDTELYTLKKIVEKIPKIYYTPDALPTFGMNLGLLKFITFGRSNIDIEPIYTVGAFYRLENDFNIWGEFSPSFTLFSDRQNEYDYVISDKWNVCLYSLGAEWKFSVSENIPGLNALAAGGLFLATVNYDKHFNSTVSSQADAVTAVGTNIKLGLSYNQFRLKNPLELYFYFNNLVSFNKIVLSAVPDDKLDLGAYLLSLTLGLRFHFW